MADKKVDKEEFYKNLAKKLKEYHSFPTMYMFKFIVPNDNQRLAEVEALFNTQANITFNESKTGKYISVTSRQTMYSAKDVISVYKSAESIEGLMSL